MEEKGGKRLGKNGSGRNKGQRGKELEKWEKLQRKI